MKSKLVIWFLALLPLTPFALVSRDDQSTLTGPIISWLASVGLLPWERMLFADQPDPYQTQFIALALPLAAPAFMCLVYSFLSDKENIGENLADIRSKAVKNLTRETFERNELALVRKLMLIAFGLYIGRLAMIVIMAGLYNSNNNFALPSQPSRDTMRTFAPLFMSLATFCGGLCLILSLGHRSVISKANSLLGE